MRLWGLSWLRFGPPAGWIAWAAAAACFVPAVARAAAPALRAAGNALADRPLAFTAATGAFLAALVLLLPDRTLFLGDAQLRLGTLQTSARPELLYPQALPLELLLHVRLPRFLAAAGLGDAALAARLQGAALAGLLVAAAVSLARATGARGAAASAAFALATFGGWLGMFTGYAKAFPTLVVLVVAVAAAAVRLAREGRGALTLGLAVAAALALHRTGVAFLPLALVAVVAVLRPGGGLAAHRVRGAAGLVLPIGLVLVAFGPRIVAVIGGYDVGAHFASEDVGLSGGPWSAALGGHRPGDLFSLFTFLTPGAWLVPVLAAATAGRVLASRAGLMLGVLAAPFVVQALVVHPAQGLFRDVDVFAPAGAALACLAALAVAGGPEVARRDARTGPQPSAIADIAGAACVAVPIALALVPLVHVADAARGLARVEAIATERPGRTAVERAKTWDFLGASFYRLGRPAEAARAFAAAAEHARNPRLFLQQAQAARAAGDLAQAQAAYESALAADPGEEAAWRGLGAVAWQRGDSAAALRAARALVELAPGDSLRRAGLAAVERAIAARAGVTPAR